MPFFTPPTDLIAGPIAADTDGIALALFRYFRPTARGRNVFLLTNGTYTEIEPGDYSDIQKIYFGGAVNDITASEEASLTAAGYGAFITP